MSILKTQEQLDLTIAKSKGNPKVLDEDKTEISDYQPNDEVRTRREQIVKHFTLGDLTMQSPRVEFNDLSVIQRMQVDQMSFNTYQPNNGDSLEGDEVNSWKSRAIRPVVRNKVISIAAHATARTIFPKLFAYNDQSDEQKDAAQLMEDLMEWAGDQSNYEWTSLQSTLTALTDPASITYTEYGEVYRNVKREKVNGKYREEKMLDEDLSGFQDVQVPVDQLYIQNFYEPDIQKQGWLIWRRVYSYSLAETKYRGTYKDFKYVKPGVQTVYSDANSSFYNVYDPNMREDDVEEIIYWNRNLDLKVIMVNGVMLTEPDNCNPRNDKLYPFSKFGYELINSRCFYYKSLAFKMQHDADIINTLYPMIIDGTYLNIMPPMFATGAETIDSNVIVPGAVTTFQDPNTNMGIINTSSQAGLKVGMDALFKVDESINASSQDPIETGQDGGQSGQTAYEISRIEQNAATVLGLFIKMRSDFVKQYGKLRLGDIIQYLTIADVDKITDDPELVYKTFLLQNKSSDGKMKTRKIKFDSSLPSDPLSDEDQLKLSYDTLKEQGGEDSGIELYRANPELVRELKYKITLSPDVLNPMSEDLERAYMLEEYDRAIANPLLDQEAVTKDFLLSAYPKSRKDVDKYFKKVDPNDPLAMITAQANGQQMQPGQQPMQQPGGSPVANAMGKTPLPQQPGISQLSQ